MKPSLWIVIDHKTGNANQAIAVAKALGYDYETKHLVYNCFGFLPNRLRFGSLIGIDLKASSNLSAPYPDIIISSGRKTAAVSSYIKKKNPASLVIHLMNPDLPFENFDLVCLPYHDALPEHQKYSNILYTIGAPTYLDQTALDNNAKSIAARLDQIKPPFIALMLGGKTKEGDYSLQDLQWLMRKASELANNLNASLLITTSRRTNPLLAQQLKDSISAPYFLYNWHKENSNYNPYLGFLSISDYFIVTGDSVSICSEVLSTGKPLYIYRQDKILYQKHRKFLDYLDKLSYTRKLEDNISVLEKWNYLPLQEANKIKDKIHALINLSS